MAADSFHADLLEQLPVLRRYALRLCDNRSLADDLVQEAMMNAWLARDRFQPGSNLKAWCATILRNVFFSYRRRSWRMLPLADEVIENLPASGADCADALDLLALRNVIGLLPVEQREALLLIGVGGLSYIDAAGICGCPPGTVKSRVSRARLRITVLMAENGASFSSDPTLTAGTAMADLVAQAARIIARKPPRNVSPAVDSEPAARPVRMLVGT